MPLVQVNKVLILLFIHISRVIFSPNGRISYGSNKYQRCHGNNCDVMRQRVTSCSNKCDITSFRDLRPCKHRAASTDIVIMRDVDCGHCSQTRHYRMKLRTINFMLHCSKQQREIHLFTTKCERSAHHEKKPRLWERKKWRRAVTKFNTKAFQYDVYHPFLWFRVGGGG